jgi:hypothetical protein
VSIFYLQFTWLCGGWYHKRIFLKKPFWKYNSWFSSKVAKLTSANYPWNDAFSCMEKIIFCNYFLIIFIVITIYVLCIVSGGYYNPFWGPWHIKKSIFATMNWYFIGVLGLFLAEVSFDTSEEKQLSYFQNGYFFKNIWWCHQPHNHVKCR